MFIVGERLEDLLGEGTIHLGRPRQPAQDRRHRLDTLRGWQGGPEDDVGREDRVAGRRPREARPELLELRGVPDPRHPVERRVVDHHVGERALVVGGVGLRERQRLRRGSEPEPQLRERPLSGSPVRDRLFEGDVPARDDDADFFQPEFMEQFPEGRPRHVLRRAEGVFEEDPLHRRRLSLTDQAFLLRERLQGPLDRRIGGRQREPADQFAEAEPAEQVIEGGVRLPDPRGTDQVDDVVRQEPFRIGGPRVELGRDVVEDLRRLRDVVGAVDGQLAPAGRPPGLPLMIGLR